ncbi:hypothetical protein RJ55_05941 [Drechmeria coniospora]|nr:hypothetical protein RJ55_05941 [Drechmeria coniospora]
MGFRITTWNVNGIRNPFAYQPWSQQRTFQSMFEILEADIVVMQELKIQRKDLRDDMVLVPGWDVFFSLPRHKKGYSGVAIYTRNATCAPIRAEEGVMGVLTSPRSSTRFRDLPKDQQIGGYPRPGQLSGNVDELELDSEGRCVILEFTAFVLLGVYSPANRDQSRNDFRLGFLDALDVRIRNLAMMGKRVILTGDLNVIRSEKDSTNVAEGLHKEGLSLDDWISMPSRRIFNHLIYEGMVLGNRDEGREVPILWDLCRLFHPEREGMNTCWDTKRNTRPANNGSRIDYVLCSNELKTWFTHANIQEGLMGSDHCPVYAVMATTVMVDGRSVALQDLMNPPGMFSDGNRVRDWSHKDTLSLSAKLIPEFDRRRSIRDMLFKRPERIASALQQNDLANEKGDNVPEVSKDPEASDILIEADIKLPPIIPSAAGMTSIESSQESSPRKRPQSQDIAGRLGKRTKSTSNGDGLKAKPVKPAPGQKTLKGFFKPLAVASEAASAQTKRTQDADAGSGRMPKPFPSLLPTPGSFGNGADGSQSSAMSSIATLSNMANLAESADNVKVFDPIEAKESWSKLLSKRVPPRCEHDEPCISLLTKKPGVNCGRSFYICPRPLGPSGEKEKGSEWRCGTFIWSSDWNSSPT